MRHRRQKITLSRTRAERRRLARKLAVAFVRQGSMRTTPTKAQFLRRFVEPLVTTARVPSITAQRRLTAALGNREAARALVKRAQAYRDRPGGYLRITRLPGGRAGDRAPQVFVEFV